jgi:hypothetical protein
MATRESERSERIDYVSSQLLPRASLLTRLLVSQLGGELSRTEVGLLSTLSNGPRRITELATVERRWSSASSSRDWSAVSAGATTDGWSWST